MRFRTFFLFLVLALTGVLALLNWDAFSVPATLWLGFRTVQAPVGLVMLGITFVVGAMALAFVIYVQGVALLESRRQAKALQVQRELAEKEEASRFTELRNFIMIELQTVTQASSELRVGLSSRLEQMEQRMQKALQDSGNTLSAYIGELEDRLERRDSLLLPPNGPRVVDGTVAR